MSAGADPNSASGILQVLVSSGGTGVITAYLLQWLKKSTWFTPLGIEAINARANFIASVLAAGVASIGVSYTYDLQTGVLAIGGLTAANMTHGLGHWAGQWIAQHIGYKAFVLPSELQAIAINEIKKLQDLTKENKPV
jgi:hypothetical protein